MVADELDLMTGQVADEHFELLLKATKISGENVIAALRDHLVCGLSAREATEKHGVTRSQFYGRLKGIREKHAFIHEVKKFYT